MKGNRIPTVYNPREVEERWYRYWMDKGYFHAEVDEDKERFSIVIPPPNVTGFLHLGHALDNTMQDILIRWKRMQGYNTVWIPGTDHAGIATQVKVEAEIAKEGLTRYDLGREKFLERVWQWKREYGGRIIDQLKRLGASCDWERERFTMDEGCSEAVREVFIRLFKKGLIYRGDRIINWCPRCKTALSDIEVEYADKQSHLYRIKYPFADGSGHVTIATTRPETMLGDVAVAVNPNDPRYTGLIGKELILPIVGRRIPLIADEYADPEFGTGAVKVTPAHDPNDFKIGERHNLPSIVVIAEDGRMNSKAGRYEGMERYDAREKILNELKEQGLLDSIEDYNHSVGHCQRCDMVIEPLLSKQWFVKMKPLAGPALQAVSSGRIRFIPERFTKIYMNWVENIHDWCISRQLWWGHRIPVWYCDECGEIIASKEEPGKCTKCPSTSLRQESDVLDTWFSSALWPFSTMGWPEESRELAHWYPTSVLVTGYDIIFFWVARMIFMGLEFMGEIPFKEVYIHGLIRDSEGRKMSKSLGNAVDPIEIIDQYGADTLRFTIITGNTPGNDMRFYTEKIEASRNFANKIWNASRFVMMNLEDFEPKADGGRSDVSDLSSESLSLEDRWILSRYNGTVDEITRLLGRYDLGEAARCIHDFIWSELCDWYIEIVKPRLYGKVTEESRRIARIVISHVLEGTLLLLHPFMPFITEGIWQHIPHEGDSIMIAPWPTADKAMVSEKAEADMSAVMEAIKAIRNIRAEMNVPPGRKIKAIVHGSKESCSLIRENSRFFKDLSGISELGIDDGELFRKPEKAVTSIIGGIEIYLPLSGMIDLDQELERLEKERAALDGEVERLEKKLSNQGFISKAPEEVVRKEREKLNGYSLKRDKVIARIEELRS